VLLLLIVIYTAFIGLGVPDSLIGAAWPAIYPEMKLPVESVSFITLIISGCTVISSMFSVGILNKLGTAKVTAISMAMTALALIGFSLAPHFFWMVPLAAVLGLGAGAIDSGLNNYIALHYKVSHMNFLHGFYGIGVSVSPYFMSLAIDKTSWRTGYIYAFIIQTVITMVLVFSFPYIGVMIIPPLISLSTSVFGIESYPFMLMGMFVIMAVSTLVFLKQLKKQKRFNKEI